jgi:hypothetical protein
MNEIEAQEIMNAESHELLRRGAGTASLGKGGEVSSAAKAIKSTHLGEDPALEDELQTWIPSPTSNEE